MKRLIICSIPKSGTYLMGQILAQLGMRDAKLHLNVDSFTDYNGVDFETGRSSPRALSVHEPLEESIARVGPGQFAVGHLPVGTAPLLREFEVIFIYRNIRDILASFCRWTANTGRWPDDGGWRQLPDGPEKLLGFIEYHGAEVRRLIAASAAWRTDPKARNRVGVTQVAFEELMGDRGASSTMSAMRKIADAVGRPDLGDTQLHDLLERAKSTETLTYSGGRSVRAAFWNEQVERTFVRRGFAYLNSKLGFDEPSQARWGAQFSEFRRAIAERLRGRRAA